MGIGSDPGFHGRSAVPDATRRESWRRASGPSSRTTGAEPACMAFGCGCGPGRGARLCRTGAARDAARLLLDPFTGVKAVLPAQNRMTRSTDFDVTVKHGMRAVQPDLVVYVRRSERASTAKVGLIIAKSVGSAVQRHRVARRLRHIARGVLPRLGPCDQLVIRALPSSRAATPSRLEHQLCAGLQRVGRSLELSQ